MKRVNYRYILIFVCSIVLIIGFVGCKKKEGAKIPVLPVVLTTAVTGITDYTAISGGNVTDSWGADVTLRGVCWSTSHSPTISDPHTSDGTGLGIFTSNITGLSPNTPYYVRAFAVNSVGAGYGTEVSFITTGTAGVLVVTTANPLNVTTSGADLGGHVSIVGNTSVTERGVCWAVTNNPTTENDKKACGSDTGSFSTTVNGLASNTPYYARAYAISPTGTYYGDTKQFLTSASNPQGCPGLETFTDPRDGQVYPTVQIGTQCWMKKNLNIGTMINTHQAQDPSAIEKYCYGNIAGNCDTYGGLYQWSTIMQGSVTPAIQGICPPGWHIPDDVDWSRLVTFIGGYPFSEKLKEAGQDHWDPPNTNADNSTGFSALGAGYVHTIDSNSYDMKRYTYFWSSTVNQNSAEVYYMQFDNGDITRYGFMWNWGFSLRCIKD